VDETSRIGADAAMAAADGRLGALVAHSTELIAVVDRVGRVTYVSPSVEQLLGWRPDELLGVDALSLVVDDSDVTHFIDQLGSRDTWQIRTRLLDIRLRHADGSFRELEGCATDRVDEPGVDGIVVNLRDVTDRRRDQRALQRSEETFRSLFAELPQPMWVYDVETLRFVEVNRAALARYNQTREAVLATTIAEHYPPDELPDLLARLAVARVGDRLSRSTRHQLRDGRMIDVEITALIIEFAGRPSVLVLAQDVTARNALEAELRHRALHDELTGLANRAHLVEHLGELLRSGVAERTPLSVALLDLDRFKVVNDSFGHAAGDDLLVGMAERLRSLAGPDDLVARLGGDEFVLVCRGLGPAEAEAFALRVASAVAEPIDLAGRSVLVTASIGVATVEAGQSPADALRNADVAMYAAKDAQHLGVQVFQPLMRQRVVDTLDLETDLRRALEEGEFVVHYQPTVALDREAISGVEALVRWNHPDRGLVLPGAFIDVLESTGLVVPVGELVLGAACADVRSWRDRFPQQPPLRLSVNLSAKQILREDIVDVVSSSLRRSNLPPDALVLEITETVLLRDTELVLERLRDLKSLGVRLALDDFGTGFSSMSYLRQFPIDALKIDKTFIDGVHLGPDQSALAKSMIRLGRTLGLETVAEGVEHAEQATVLHSIRCDVAQGYFFARPLDADALELLLARSRAGFSFGRFDRFDAVHDHHPTQLRHHLERSA
jgi:diguanylate cyclase (GGDEF)-like protein/PAS domain S-box-containing protein